MRWSEADPGAPSGGRCSEPNLRRVRLELDAGPSKQRRDTLKILPKHSMRCRSDTAIGSKSADTMSQPATGPCHAEPMRAGDLLPFRAERLMGSLCRLSLPNAFVVLDARTTLNATTATGADQTAMPVGVLTTQTHCVHARRCHGRTPTMLKSRVPSRTESAGPSVCFAGRRLPS